MGAKQDPFVPLTAFSFHILKISASDPGSCGINIKIPFLAK